jgi:antitoxin ParD1/3/4
MPTRNVVITDHQQQLIETLVDSGRYQNASEVLRDGLRLVEQREALEAEKLKVLRKAVDEGWAAVAAGNYVDLNDDELDDYIAGLGKRPSKPTATG